MTYQAAEPALLSKPQVYSLAESAARQMGFEPGGDLYDLVRKMGGRVEIEDTLLSDPEQTGSLYVDGPNRFRIIVPSHTSPERDRFTIAHELGHFVLHYLWKKQKNPEFPDRLYALRKGSDRIEWEANWFAAAFLMPEAEFKEKFEQLGGSVGQLAELFKVSHSATEVRARGLGLT
jgi:predicted transcriptional regulator